MAKRSVKKARQQQRHQPAPPAPATPSRRQFWIGVLAAAVVLIPLALVGVVIASGGDSASDPAAEEQAALKKSIESEAATLRKQTQVRDKEQVKELTDHMRATVDAVGPVLAGLSRTLPPGNDEKVGAVAGAAAVAQWRKTVRAENAYFADTVSGETGTNVARGGFAAALDALNESVETYALAADAGHRSALLERSRRERDLAVRTWSVAATQLDAINIATGYGHQHVFLSGSADVGGMSADPAPEGSGAEHGGE